MFRSRFVQIRNFSVSSTLRNDIYIAAAVRTPIGKFQGSFKGISATKLGSIAAKAAIERSGIPASEFDEVIFGNVISAGIGQAPARQVVFGAGLGEKVEATTINKVCASGLKTVSLAAQAIKAGDSNVVLAGGMENMSDIPFYFPRGLVYGNPQAKDGILEDGLMDVYDNIHMGKLIYIYIYI